MNHPNVDFNRISKALAQSKEALKQELQPGEPALHRLRAAEKDFRQALSFKLSSCAR
ncbi:hypothetical protein [Bacillus sp. T33-2]|uniref:hypothetical protein n=1 Tax=Bacillus sp. T33-2 TaxID=2054168 RepID=UPI0015E144F8|nr:hypothetical protein [Bacillus sp. T33-2]